MRRGVALAVVAVLALAGAGCSSDKPKQNDTSPTTDAAPAVSAQPSAAPSVNVSANPSQGSGDASASAGVPCADASKWTTGSEDNKAMATAGLYNLRAATHDGCDRLVFDINGPEPAGYHVGYVDVVTTPGKGDAVKVKGAAAIQVTIRAWHCTYFGQSAACPQWKIGQVLVDAPLSNVQEVKYAGVQEGQCTFAVGVDAKRPFHVTTWKEGSVRHVIVDIVHAA
jgi:hypothetical protein